MEFTRIVYEEYGAWPYPEKYAIDLKKRSMEFRCIQDPETLEPVMKGVALRRDKWARFDELLESCRFSDWKDRYDNDWCDGTQWELIVKSGRRHVKRVFGSNVWPREARAFRKLLKLFGCQDLDWRFERITGN